MLRRTMLGLMAGAAFLGVGTAQAAPDTVTVGYQQIYSPWLTRIADGGFDAATGAKIKWVQFDSGAKVITAMASGNVDIGVAGSSPVAAAASRQVEVQLFWILDDIAAAEAMVVRNGSGIDPKDPSTLKGKKIGVPFVSTTHFHTMYALELWGLGARDVQVLNMQPADIAAAWERGDVDAGFVWDPALSRLKKTGTVMITSGELSAKGKPTFDGLIVNKAFGEKNAEFMAKFVRVIADADAEYRAGKDLWATTAAPAMTKLIGGEAADVPPTLALYGYPTLEEQVSPRWLGGGKEGGATKALIFTSEFLKAQGRIDAVLPDYAPYVNPAYAQAALKLGK